MIHCNSKEVNILVPQQQQNLARRLGTSKMHFSPPVAKTAVRSKAVVLLLLVTSIVGFCNCSMFCCVLLYVLFSFAIILMGALLSLSSWCLVIFVWLFLTVPWVCLQFVIVVFPDHTHLLFLHKLTSTVLKSNELDWMDQYKNPFVLVPF